jgi:hypothetical protein
MPSNTDLVKAIGTISAELEKDAPETEGKNNGELANILSGLKAEKKEAEKDLTPDAGAKAAAVAKEEATEAKAEPAKKPPYYVMPGKCLTSKRGLLADGDEIKADDLAGGKEALDAFVESGHVGKA